MKEADKKPWYESRFEHYADSYDNESYVQGTIGEVDFIEKIGKSSYY